MIPRLDAFMVVKNGTHLGYPWLEAIRAVLPWVGKFWIEDGFSADNTTACLEKLAHNYDNVEVSYYEWPQMQTGFAIGAATQHLLERLNRQSTTDWLLYVQADELWSAGSLNWIAKLFEYGQRFDSVAFRFLHLAHNYQELQFPPGQESYTHAIRLIRNHAVIKSHRDAWTFEGVQDTVRAPDNVKIAHANSTHWLNYSRKTRSHADTLYTDLPYYRVSAEERERELAEAIEVPELWARTTSPYAEWLPECVLPTVGWPEYRVREELLR
jgi:hypothetical protein